MKGRAGLELMQELLERVCAAKPASELFGGSMLFTPPTEEQMEQAGAVRSDMTLLTAHCMARTGEAIPDEVREEVVTNVMRAFCRHDAMWPTAVLDFIASQVDDEDGGAKRVADFIATQPGWSIEKCPCCERKQVMHAGRLNAKIIGTLLSSKLGFHGAEVIPVDMAGATGSPHMH